MKIEAGEKEENKREKEKKKKEKTKEKEMKRRKKKKRPKKTRKISKIFRANRKWVRIWRFGGTKKFLEFQ